MEYLVFRSAKSGNRVVVPAPSSMIVDRAGGGAVVYAIGGNGQDRMVWEVPSVTAIHVVQTMREGMNMHLPAEGSGSRDASGGGGSSAR